MQEVLSTALDAYDNAIGTPLQFVIIAAAIFSLAACLYGVYCLLSANPRAVVGYLYMMVGTIGAMVLLEDDYVVLKEIAVAGFLLASVVGIMRSSMSLSTVGPHPHSLIVILSRKLKR